MAEFIRTWLDVAILAEVEATFNGGGHMTKYDKISRHLGRITTAVSQFLGLIRGGQMLNGAICPCCRGVTPKHPAGGAVTMRIEEIAKGKTATELRPAIEAVHAVVCWNPSCEPAEQKWHLVPRPSRLPVARMGVACQAAHHRRRCRSTPSRPASPSSPSTTPTDPVTPKEARLIRGNLWRCVLPG